MKRSNLRPVCLVSCRVSLRMLAVLCVSLMAMFSLCASGAVIYVPANYPTIQQAINASSDADEIIVSPGTYVENINFNGKNIILRSTDPTSPIVVASTIIDGNQAGSVVMFSGAELETCVLSGFTITNGNSPYGGAIFGNYALATIRNNAIQGNTANYGGGLHHCYGAVEDNTISGNVANSYGGGLYECGGTIEHNTISENSAVTGGGLFNCGNIKNNIISNNVAENGGGLYHCDGTIQNNTIFNNSPGGGLSNCSGTIQNNTIWGNSASGYGGGLDSCLGTIQNCIVWENSASTIDSAQLYNCSLPTYSCIQDWTGGGAGNLTDDPQLIDPAAGNFHLQATSPCIDAGCLIAGLTQDFEGDPRPYDGTSEPRGDGSDYDIGADEFVPVAAYNFTTDQQGWTSHTVPLVFSEPEFAVTPGFLQIISTNNTSNFGYWQSPENAVPIEADYLYRARFSVLSDQSNQSVVPQIRLRANSLNLQQADYMGIESTGDGGASPSPSGTTYDLAFVPPANDTYSMLSFDLLNFNPEDAAQATFSLDSVIVERTLLDSLTSRTLVRTYDFTTSADGWTSGGAPIVFTNPEFIHEAGALTLRSTTNTNTFGYWSSTASDITITTGCLYRATFEVRTDVTRHGGVPLMRLRFNAGNLQASRTLGIESVGDGGNSARTTITVYDNLYFLPPANCVGENLIVSFDMGNFDPGDAPTGALILERVTIETMY